jgi:hypothetical protein
MEQWCVIHRKPSVEMATVYGPFYERDTADRYARLVHMEDDGESVEVAGFVNFDLDPEEEGDGDK